MSPPLTLTIAGSDSGGGAGIQADLKTFAARGVYASCAITALTAQNTRHVEAIFPVPASFVARQIDAVMHDLNPRVWKTGMQGSVEIVKTVAERARHYGITALIVDPVMAATSGDALLNEDALLTLKQELLPLALLITPNRQEAALLAKQDIQSLTDMHKAAGIIYDLCGRNVLIKGGDLTTTPGQAVDIFFDGQHYHEFSAARIDAHNTHGTGCTLSAAIAAEIAKGAPLLKAIEIAKDYVRRAIIAGRDWTLGHGHGPLNHFPDH